MKKTLLLAVAALGISGIAAQAQVYSQNIVGYANVPTTGASLNYLLSIPFKIGVSNGANEVFGSSLPEFSNVLLWDTGSASYTVYQTDTSSPTGWSDPGFTPVDPPLLPVGKGFFLSPSAPVTNVFAGTIAINVGTSNVTTFAGASVNYLVGGVVPYAGSVTNGNNSSGGLNLNALPEFSNVLVWDTATASYTVYQTDTSSPTGWSDPGFTPVNPPSVSVGQGFFVSPSAPGATWTTGL